MNPRNRFIFAVLIVLPAGFALAAGCASTRESPSKHVFTFTHEGRGYEILSSDAYSALRGNYLIGRDGSEVVLRAVDEDQDGQIDDVEIGDVSREHANSIYMAGIAKAWNAGRFHQQDPFVAYEMRQSGQLLVVRTYRGADVYNRFIVYDAADNSTTVGLDSDLDGRLDRIERPGLDTKVIQEAYAFALDAGLREGRIEHIESRFLVKIVGGSSPSL